MKLIIGIGNPGEKYKNSRHNIGFMVVDKIVTSNKLQVTGGPDSKLVTCYMLPVTKTLLAKPQTFMNSSGISVKKLIDHYGVNSSELWVIHDDLDIPLGDYKIQFGKGPKVHHGIQSIEEELGTKEFWRVRIGVDNRPNKFSIFNSQFSNRVHGEPASAQKLWRGKDYVLQDFTEEEREILEKVIRKLVKELKIHL